PVPPDDGGDTPVPPDDGDDTPVKHDPVVYNNNVTWDQDAKTVEIRNTTFTYAKNEDGSYTLTGPNGKTTIVKTWSVDEAANTVSFDGVNTVGGITWSYDDDGKIHIVKEAGTVADGTTGDHFQVNDATITDKGGNTALNGGTVMVINGDHIELTNEGKTEAVGEGSVVGILTGDNITINNNGETVVDGGTAVIVNGDRTIFNNTGDSTVINGGTGAVITGNDVRVNNKGNMSVDGENSTGSKITGNNATVKQEGDLYVSNAALGIYIDGDDAIVSNKGNITVVDEKSTGVSLSGDASTFINMGDISVSNGSSEANATGILIEGNHSTLINVGDIISNNFSTGIRVAGDDGQISLAGRMDVGNYSTGLDVSGNNNAMKLATNELNVTGNMATGVNISGDGNNIDITGNILVDKDQTADNAADHFFDPSVGIRVSGNSNDLMLDGQLTLKVDSELAQHAYGNFSGSQENISGLVVSGDDNSVTLRGGIQLIGEASSMTDGSAPAASRTGYGDIPLIQVDGHSSVYLGGDSVISGEFPVGYTDIIQTSNNAFLEITDDATFSMKDIDVYAHYNNSTSAILSASSGSQVINNGFVELWNIGFAEISGTGSVATNNGTVLLEQYDYSSEIDVSPESSSRAFFSYVGGTAVNNGTITAKVMEQYSVLNMFNALSLSDPSVFNNSAISMTGMTAQDDGSALNGANGVIDMYGRGNVGMLAINNSTVNNAGQITLDTLWVDENDTTTLRNDIGSGNARKYGVGMAVGTDSYDGARKNATAFNQQPGTITIYNAGAGMAAYGTDNTVVNQGTINLEKNENFDDSLGANKLVGMAVYNGGTAVNDQTGIININAENGQAFYNDGTGTIVNYGTICTFGICQDQNAYNPTDGFVSLSWRNGDIITVEGETLNLSSYGGTTDITATAETLVTNAGTVTGGPVTVAGFGHLVNETTGSINEVDIATGGEYTNQGTTKTVSVDGGVFTNEGVVTGQVGTTVAGSVINNSGTINTVEQWASTFYNAGTVTAWKGASASTVMNNEADGTVNKVNFSAAATFNNAGTVHSGSVDKNATFNNLDGGVVDLLDNGLWAGHFNNWGTVNGDADIATGGNGHTLYNGTTGVINGQVTTSNNNAGSRAINDGTINIDKNNTIAMNAHGSAKMVNNGTINVGSEGTTQTGMIGMQLASDAKADGVVENNGTINIYANNSWAFSKLGSNGHIVNNGTVYIDDSVNGSGLIKQSGTAIEGSGEGGDGTEVHYVDFTAPEEPTITPYDGSHSSSVSRNDGMNNLNGYVVGTNADGSAGKLMVNNASMKGVEINTAFAAGTADKTVSFDDVVQGSNLTDAQAITSTSVVWQATGSTDASGNVDVTMSKNAYTDVATDASVNDVAKALDAGYTNNELYTSLNVGTTAELNSALKQVSGSQATTVFREARVLSNRFSMLADAAPKMGNGLAFNVVAKGDPRAELGNNTEYDMLALRKTLDLSENQTMSLEYGIARLDGDGAQKAGDNGVTGGYSQFFGLKHQMSFDNGMSWNNALRYDIHQLDSSRSVAYGDISKTADTNVKQQYLEFRSEGAKTFEPREGLKITPYVGVKLRHTLEGGYQERNAGDFNLSMNNGSETAVDSIVGLKLDYAGKDGWSANAALEGGPNLSYTKSQRTASLAGAGSQHFKVDDGQKGGGINSLASVGVKYSSKESSLNLDAYHWKEDGVSDKGVMLNFKKTF
ncbi:TPA: autotransporter domain-containing protein, partial [Escherichia coli]|nr:autotransporter domain-containing protein [Escherichia coli]HBH8044650.1 autotransporter domain-containing protein [Escherichia coli]